MLALVLCPCMQGSLIEKIYTLTKNPYSICKINVEYAIICFAQIFAVDKYIYMYTLCSVLSTSHGT